MKAFYLLIGALLMLLVEDFLWIKLMRVQETWFGTGLEPSSKHVKEVNISSLEQQVASLNSLVCQMAVGKMQT
jgi:hypothetical protein